MSNLAESRDARSFIAIASLPSALETAWLTQFHSPSRALEKLRLWRDFNAGRNESVTSNAFAALIEVACSLRTEEVEISVRLMEVAREKLSHVAPHDANMERLQARAAGIQGSIEWRFRRFDDALARYEEAIGHSEALTLSDLHMIRHWRAIALLGVGRPDLAFRDSLAAREHFRDRDPAGYALLSFNIGAMLMHAGDWDAAELSTREAGANAHLVGAPGFAIMCRANLAYCLINAGRVDAARAEVREALEEDRSQFLRLRPGDVLTTVAEILVETGYLEDATDYIRSALGDAERRKFTIGIGTANWNAGRIALLRNNPAEAVQYWQIALRQLRHHPHLTQLWKTALAVSNLYAARGDHRRAWTWHRRFHRTYHRWQMTTRGIRLAYSQALLKLESTRAERDAVEAERARLAEAMTQLESLNTELQRRVHQVESLQAELREQAQRDTLTGLLNRRGLAAAIEAMIGQSHGLRVPATVAMLDLDHFKQVNDQFGHVLGDRLLAATGKLLLEFFRRSDLAFRFGGDEFCVLMPGADLATAQHRLNAFATRLRETLGLAQTELPFEVTVSFGLATYPKDARTPQALLEAAGAALIAVKRRAPGNT